MSLTDLVPPQYRAVAVCAVLAAVAAVGFAEGWAVNGWRLGTQVATLKQEHAQAVAKAQGEALAQVKAAQAERDALAGKLATLDRDYTEQLRTLNYENEALRGRVAAGSAVVRVRGAVCPAVGASVPQAPAGSGVDTGTGAVLSADAGQTVLSLRLALGRVAVKLNACQAAIRAMTGQ